MKNSTLTLLLGAALCIPTACASATTPEPASSAARAEEHVAITTERLEPYECGTIKRMHTFAGLFLASQPAPDDFAQAKLSGVRTVLNIRHAAEIKDFDEAAVVEGLGLNYVHLPWNGPDELTDEIFDRTREILNTAERPILFHCGSANRVGATWLPWRVLDGGLTYEEALEEARTVGLRSPDYEAKARDYVLRRQG